MQFLRFTKYIALSAALGFLSSCDDFLDVNASPNAVLVAPASNVLVSAQTQMGFLMGSDIHRYTSLFVQQNAGQGGASVQTVNYDTYNISATDVNNLWRSNIYGGALADMQKLNEQTTGTSPAYSGIAKLMQAYTFSVTTDAFGDIPFTDALKFGENVKPVYDKSADVYTKLIPLIDDGIADLDKASALTPTTDDLIYGGALAKWKKFGNTLKLRLYLHYSNKLSATVNPGFATLLAKGPATFMQDNTDNFQLTFDAVAGKTNPINQFETSRLNNFFPSATLVELMNAKTDPRRPSYFTVYTATDGSFTGYRGVANGTGVNLSTNFSRINTFLRGARTGTGVQDYTGDAPIRMLTFAEYNFILAEYYLRTGDVVNAQAKLNAGVTASMQMAGVAAADITAYLGKLTPLTALSAQSLRTIIEEKYVANYGVAVEPWSDWRRTGYPALTPVSNGVLKQIPRILPYSDLERVANRENTPARTDLTTASVFWDPGL
ncbi:SusD/RagB family nutrient-binding outer membrane lipoprotein [Hymenobacter sp. BT491]|uniref:SusD/RagB family nutrient-binding outer membrane lipoprotein n=1 Tax=Hymenobacter sp. BT491 TaxID=2766779 RepID=UPI001653C064|nr:SusD/RagB family nutrient-binding outer membrane lipoprotein [Hymenobacter sp. BT491]MBC6988449.1 SusD/RagB family nutrient-binding outer membrane lipoprotein [Hymenobacter sp. BT491]